MDETSTESVRRPSGSIDAVLVVDLANLMGSRPDGWWRDRAGAGLRWTRDLATLVGRTVTGPDGTGLHLSRVLAVVEGQVRDIPEVPGVTLVRAAADGDSEVVRTCRDVLDGGGRPWAVTADRGLRARLPEGTGVAGPGWLIALPGISPSGGVGGAAPR